MALSPFAFNPVTGWNDATVFPTYEASEVKVRSDLQKLHDQTKNCLNSVITEINESLLSIETTIPHATGSVTVYSSLITEDHEVLLAELGDPSVQGDDMTIWTHDGLVSVNTYVSEDTTLKLVIGKAQATI